MESGKKKTYYEQLLGNYFRFRDPHFENSQNDIVTSKE